MGRPRNNPEEGFDEEEGFEKNPDKSTSKYTVKSKFTDKVDSSVVYLPGDPIPEEGFDEERISDLLSRGLIE